MVSTMKVKASSSHLPLDQTVHVENLNPRLQPPNDQILPTYPLYLESRPATLRRDAIPRQCSVSDFRPSAINRAPIATGATPVTYIYDGVKVDILVRSTGDAFLRASME